MHQNQSRVGMLKFISNLFQICFKLTLDLQGSIFRKSSENLDDMGLGCGRVPKIIPMQAPGGIRGPWQPGPCRFFEQCVEHLPLSMAWQDAFKRYETASQPMTRISARGRRVMPWLDSIRHHPDKFASLESKKLENILNPIRTHIITFIRTLLKDIRSVKWINQSWKMAT